MLTGFDGLPHFLAVAEFTPNAQDSLVKEEGKRSEPRVLLVDDTASNTMVAKAILKRYGAVDPDTAENGAIALEHVRSKRYDLIYMDCMMPEMDGYEATRAIRGGEAGEQNVKVPIIALTANAMHGDREICLESGMSDYITKPIDPRALMKSLEDWLGREHA